MLKTIGKWLLLITLLAYATVAAVWASGSDRKIRCRGIEVYVEGDSRSDDRTRAGVVSELALLDKDLTRREIRDIDVQSIENHLRRFSNFESVECVITSGGKLRVNVVPMVPELRVFDGDHSYYINKDGKRIESRSEFFCDVPVVSGRFGKSFHPQELLPVARAISSDSLVKDLVAMIHAEDSRNILLIPRIKGHVINIGDCSDLEDKFSRIGLMYRKVMPYRGWNTYDTVSVKFRGQIVATRRDKKPLHPVAEIHEEIDYEEIALAGQTVAEPDGGGGDGTPGGNGQKRDQSENGR